MCREFGPFPRSDHLVLSSAEGTFIFKVLLTAVMSDDSPAQHFRSPSSSLHHSLTSKWKTHMSDPLTQLTRLRTRSKPKSHGTYMALPCIRSSSTLLESLEWLASIPPYLHEPPTSKLAQSLACFSGCPKTAIFTLLMLSGLDNNPKTSWVANTQ